MKSLDELISRFNDIQNLPVSEELLGAYIDGKLDAATSAFVESNFIDSPRHVDFVESLKSTEILVTDLETFEIGLAETLAIDNMDLPSLNMDSLSSDFNVFNYAAFRDYDNLFPLSPSYGNEQAKGNNAEWEAIDENNDIFSQGADIFWDDNQSLDVDNLDGIDNLPDDLSL